MSNRLALRCNFIYFRVKTMTNQKKMKTMKTMKEMVSLCHMDTYQKMRVVWMTKKL